MANDPSPLVLRLLSFTVQTIDESRFSLGEHRHLVTEGGKEFVVISSPCEC